MPPCNYQLAGIAVKHQFMQANWVHDMNFLLYTGSFFYILTYLVVLMATAKLYIAKII